MNTAENPNQIHRVLDSRLKQLMPQGPVLLAAVVRSARRCGRYGCKCNRGETASGPSARQIGALSHLPRGPLNCGQGTC